MTVLGVTVILKQISCADGYSAVASSCDALWGQMLRGEQSHVLQHGNLLTFVDSK